jgi:hypothetical protein
MTTVPFRIKDHLGGLAECSGLLKLEKTAVVVELQSKDALVGLLKSKIKRVGIPFESIEEISFIKSLFGAKIFLRVSDLRLQTQVPNSEDGEIVLKIRKKHSLDATELVSAVQLGIADQKLQRMEDHFA